MSGLVGPLANSFLNFAANTLDSSADHPIRDRFLVVIGSIACIQLPNARYPTALFFSPFIHGPIGTMNFSTVTCSKPISCIQPSYLVVFVHDCPALLAASMLSLFQSRNCESSGGSSPQPVGSIGS